MGKKYPIVLIEHEAGKMVWCWNHQQGIETVDECLHKHPENPVSVRIVKMTEKQYDALDDYEGDCQ